MRLRPVMLLARRSVLGRFRHPSLFLPDLVGPLLFTSVLWGSFSRTTILPNFPTVRSYLDFVVVGAVVVGVCFTATDVADDLTADINDGFFDRLVVSPVAPSSLILGRLAGAAIFAGFESLVIVGVLAAFGASIRGGSLAVLVICALAMVLALGMGSLGAILALRQGVAERAAPLFVPLVFLALFVSSAYFPRSAMDGWFNTIAGLNPVSWIVEDMRHQVIVGFDWRTAGQGLGIVAGVAVLAVFSAVRAVRAWGRAQ